MIKEIESKLEYSFKNPEHLHIALTHSSFSNENKKKLQNYERHEFLGDSVLGFVTSNYIFKNCPDLAEGELTKLRSYLVCEKTLCKFALSLNLGKYIKVSKGEKNCGGNTRPSILADVFEAIVAAIYLDGGIKSVSEFVLKFIANEIKISSFNNFKDYKTTLQEIVQKNPEETIEYVVNAENGPDHNKKFEVLLKINNNVMGVGIGRSKKLAEQEAAKKALSLMGC